MTAVLRRLFPEVNAGYAIPGDRIVDELVVRILVTDRDAVMPVRLDNVIFKAAVAYAPAQEKTNIAVVVQPAALYEGVRASRPWMNAVPRVPVRLAVQHANAIADLE